MSSVWKRAKCARLTYGNHRFSKSSRDKGEKFREDWGKVWESHNTLSENWRLPSLVPIRCVRADGPSENEKGLPLLQKFGTRAPSKYGQTRLSPVTKTAAGRSSPK